MMSSQMFEFLDLTGVEEEVCQKLLLDIKNSAVEISLPNQVTVSYPEEHVDDRGEVDVYDETPSRQCDVIYSCDATAAPPVPGNFSSPSDELPPENGSITPIPSTIESPAEIEPNMDSHYTMGELPLYSQPNMEDYQSHPHLVHPVNTGMPNGSPYYIPHPSQQFHCPVQNSTFVPQPQIYVENCHVNVGSFGNQTNCVYQNPPPQYQQCVAQIYPPYAFNDSSLSMPHRMPSDKLEYEHQKLHDPGHFKYRIQGRGKVNKRKSREALERSNSVSSDHSTYSDGGNKPPPMPSSNPYTSNFVSIPYYPPNMNHINAAQGMPYVQQQSQFIQSAYMSPANPYMHYPPPSCGPPVSQYTEEETQGDSHSVPEMQQHMPIEQHEQINSFSHANYVVAETQLVPSNTTSDYTKSDLKDIETSVPEITAGVNICAAESTHTEELSEFSNTNGKYFLIDSEPKAAEFLGNEMVNAANTVCIPEVSKDERAKVLPAQLPKVDNKALISHSPIIEASQIIVESVTIEQPEQPPINLTSTTAAPDTKEQFLHSPNDEMKTAVSNEMVVKSSGKPSVMPKNKATNKQVSGLVYENSHHKAQKSNNVKNQVEKKQVASHSRKSLGVTSITQKQDKRRSLPIPNEECASSNGSTNKENITEEKITQNKEAVNGGELPWGGHKKCWSQLFKPGDIPGKQVAYVSPYNSKEKEPSIENIPAAFSEHKHAADNETDKIKMGELLKKHKQNYHPVMLQPRGLINKNYWCYVNAPLQALLACPSLSQLMFTISKNTSATVSDIGTPFISSIADFFKEFTLMAAMPQSNRKDKAANKKELDISTGNPFEPTSVHKMLANSKENQFTEGCQQDAEEMLSYVLNGLHDEMVEALKLSGALDKNSIDVDKDISGHESADDNEQEWKVQGPKKKSYVTRTAQYCSSPISEIFWGQLRSIFQHAGGSTTANLQPFNTLPLDIQSPKVDTLKDAFCKLVAKEEISGFTCPKTKEEVTASNQVMLECLPRVLILQLKRFIYDKDGGLQKVTKRLQFPIDLEITKDLLSPNVRGKFKPIQRKYKLFAVVNHEGKEANKGHYISDIYHSGYNCWLRYDDSSVKPIMENIVLKHEPPRVPYLLFYKRNDTFSTGPYTNSKPKA